MILLTRQAGPTQAARAIAVFGEGLIGSAIAGACLAAGGFDARSFHLDWRDDARLESGMAAASAAIDEVMIARAAEASVFQPPALAVVWSAGRAGFAADEAQVAGELANFSRVLGIADRLAQLLPPDRVRFHLISSAGGLFEGQRLLAQQSVPAPQRPYGRLKWAQEQALLEAHGGLGKLIYRPTSVFGPIRPLQRRGLISAMLLNGVRGRVTPITGQMTTLRDFVWVGDIAAYVARQVLGDRTIAGPHITLLAGGRPSSIREVALLIERIIHRRLYLSYRPDATNTSDITVAPSALPDDWRPSDMVGNVRTVYNQALATGAFFAAEPW